MDYPDALPGGQREQWLPNEQAWFEYHCLEEHDSGDAPAWYRSHQMVRILSERDSDGARQIETFAERGSEGLPVIYSVQFADGLIWDVFEDELMVDPVHFYRPDPPAA